MVRVGMPPESERDDGPGSSFLRTASRGAAAVTDRHVLQREEMSTQRARLPMADGSWSGLASAALAVGVGHSAGPSEAGAVARRPGSSACATSPVKR